MQIKITFQDQDENFTIMAIEYFFIIINGLIINTNED